MANKEEVTQRYLGGQDKNLIQTPWVFADFLVLSHRGKGEN